MMGPPRGDTSRRPLQATRDKEAEGPRQGIRHGCGWRGLEGWGTCYHPGVKFPLKRYYYSNILLHPPPSVTRRHFYLSRIRAQVVAVVGGQEEEQQ